MASKNIRSRPVRRALVPFDTCVTVFAAKLLERQHQLSWETKGEFAEKFLNSLFFFFFLSLSLSPKNEFLSLHFLKNRSAVLDELDFSFVSLEVGELRRVIFNFSATDILLKRQKGFLFLCSWRVWVRVSRVTWREERERYSDEYRCWRARSACIELTRLRRSAIRSTRHRRREGFCCASDPVRFVALAFKMSTKVRREALRHETIVHWICCFSKVDPYSGENWLEAFWPWKENFYFFPLPPFNRSFPMLSREREQWVTVPWMTSVMCSEMIHLSWFTLLCVAVTSSRVIRSTRSYQG